jgi:hypothetical protein
MGGGPMLGRMLLVMLAAQTPPAAANVADAIAKASKARREAARLGARARSEDRPFFESSFEPSLAVTA